MLKRICLSLIAIIVSGCAANNNVTVTTVQGACPNESGAPYCMSITMSNNGGGQNWINSTNFPINGLTMTVTGATNIASPATNTNLTDPNGCTNSTIKPGSNCTFYMQITSEGYPVESSELITTTLSYTVNDTLFGGSNNTSSSTFTINQNTNLYIMGVNGNLWTYSNANMSSNVAESAPPVLSIAADNSAFGFLYLSTNGGIYTYGLGTTSSSINPSQSSLTGVNNLFTTSGNLYASSTNLNAAGIWSYSLAAESWNNGGGTIYQAGSTVFSSNVNAVSASSTIYLSSASGTSGYTNIIYACSLNSSSIGSCSTEGRVLDSESSQALVYSLGFQTSIGTYSGLYAGTSRGLFAENNNGESSTWTRVKYTGSDITNQINSIATSSTGALFAGDQSGNIWYLESNPINASKLVTLDGASITNMIVDNNGNALYFIAHSSTGYGLYSCSLETNDCTPTVINTTSFSSVQIVGLAIASQLSN